MVVFYCTVIVSLSVMVVCVLRCAMRVSACVYPINSISAGQHAARHRALHETGHCGQDVRRLELRNRLLFGESPLFSV